MRLNIVMGMLRILSSFLRGQFHLSDNELRIIGGKAAADVDYVVHAVSGKKGAKAFQSSVYIIWHRHLPIRRSLRLRIVAHP